MKNKKNIRHALSSLFLWIGLLSCVAFGLKKPDLFNEAHKIISLQSLFLILAIWWCAVTTWQYLVNGFLGGKLHFSDSARHFAKLQIGKYAPGGIWGFLARQNDSAMPEYGKKNFFAGTAEQLLGLFCAAIVGTSVYFSALTRNYFFLLTIFFIPWLYQIFLRGSFLVIRKVRYFSNIEYDRREIILASAYAVLQQLATIGLLVSSADSLLGVSGWDSLALTGAYLVSVVIGMLAIFAPGGIFVREAAFVFLVQASIGSNDALMFAASLRILFFLADIFYAILAALSKIIRDLFN